MIYTCILILILCTGCSLRSTYPTLGGMIGGSAGTLAGGPLVGGLSAGAGVLVVVLIISFVVYRRILRHQETMSIKSNLDTNFQTTATAQFDNQNTTGMQMEQQNSVFIANQKSIHEL